MCDISLCNEINPVQEHIYQPILSYGVINFRLTGNFEKYNYILKKKYIIKDYNPTINKINLYWFNNKNINKECTELIDELRKSILFLLISRKNSLGFVEFIRGKYEVLDIESVKYLFDQMTDLEISNIINKDFDTLWCLLWQKTSRNKIYEREYEMSLNKFNKLKELYSNELLLLRPKYPISEWGFPKGRRNNKEEKDIKCAVRECCEETSLEQSEMNILDRIYPISEQFRGTNHVEYKHIYYLSIIDSIRNLNTLSTPEQFIEVENVGWFKYERIMNLIRPYHIEKKKLVEDIKKFVAYNIL